MPSARRWSVPHQRIVATAVLTVIGLFLICGSVGMGTWVVAAVGVAVLAVGAGIFALSALNSRSSSEVAGIGHVVSASSPPTGVPRGRCRMSLVIHARGISEVGVKIRDPAVPVAKWPHPGTDLPVMVSLDNPQRTRVLWGEVATHAEYAAESARLRAEGRAAEAMAGDYAYVDSGDAGGRRASSPGQRRAREVVDAHVVAEDDTGGSYASNVYVTSPGPGDAYTDAVFAERIRSGEDVGESADLRTAAGPDDYLDVEPIDGDDAFDEPVIVNAGPRTIEMDVMDPSLMRRSGTPPPTVDSSAAGAAPPPRPRRSDGSRPSPFPRRPAPKPTHAPPTPTDTEQPPVADEATSEAAATSPAPPEWPPRSAAAARFHQQWGDTRQSDEPEEIESEEIESEPPHVPRNRAASPDEVFDQDELDEVDDGPEYSSGPDYAPDAGYDDDTGYSPGAGYAGSR